MSVRALALASVAAVLSCSTRSVTTGPPLDSGAGGGTAGTQGSGVAGIAGAGTGGTGGYGGRSDGFDAGDGSVRDDGSVDQSGDAFVRDDGSVDQAGDATVRDDGSVDQAGDASVRDDGSTDQGGDASVDHVGDGPLAADAAVCEGISSAYAAAVHLAQECMVGAANQCAVQVRSGFFCNCTTFVNGGADALAAIVTQYQGAGCQQFCGGTCAQPKSLSCLADTTSSTGGRCKLPDVLTLEAANNGGTFTVAAGEEIDITLESVAAGSYSTNVMLSSTDLATVLEVTIPAGPPAPNGPTHLYRVRLLSAGEVQIKIPFESDGPGSSVPAYTVTISAHQ